MDRGEKERKKEKREDDILIGDAWCINCRGACMCGCGCVCMRVRVCVSVCVNKSTKHYTGDWLIKVGVNVNKLLRICLLIKKEEKQSEGEGKRERGRERNKEREGKRERGEEREGKREREVKRERVREREGKRERGKRERGVEREMGIQTTLQENKGYHILYNWHIMVIKQLIKIIEYRVLADQWKAIKMGCVIIIYVLLYNNLNHQRQQRAILLL